MANIKNTCIEMELEDGQKVKMTLTYYRLYQLKPKNKAVYDKYNQIMTKGLKEELENVTVLYTAYLCANIENIDECMTEMEFLQQMPSDRKYVTEILQQLMGSKKK